MADSDSDVARRTALLVIDVQERVMDGAWRSDDVVARIAVLIARARDAGAPVIYVQHEDQHMVAESPPWQIVAAIAPQPGDILIRKRFSDAFVETDLRETLQRLGITHVVMAGAQTDACIRASSMRTLIEGFDLTLVDDCHTTEDTSFDEVDISAEQIIAHTNLCLWSLTYPGQVCTIEAHDTVQLAS